MNLRPPPFLTLLVVFCAGIALSHWLIGAQAFDRAFRGWVSRTATRTLETPAPRVAPDAKPAAPRRTPAEEQLKRSRADGLAALGRATEAVERARHAAADWARSVEPLRRNYEGHLVAAHSDLVACFRVLYETRPGDDAVTNLTRRLQPYGAAAPDLGPFRSDLARLEFDADALRERYSNGVAEAAGLVSSARARGWWSPIELGLAIWDPGPGVTLRPGPVPGTYALDFVPGHPALRWRRRW